MESSPLRVLLVEDQREQAEVAARLLRYYGFHVEVAFNGIEALGKLASNPDVVLLDLGLPHMDGWQLARHITEQGIPATGKRPLLVAVTGYGDDQARRRSEEAGIDLHLTKPVDPKHLQALLNRFHRIVS
jgi:CheY-like chemotaxis protein